MLLKFIKSLDFIDFFTLKFLYQQFFELELF